MGKSCFLILKNERSFINYATVKLQKIVNEGVNYCVIEEKNGTADTVGREYGEWHCHISGDQAECALL